MAGGPIVNRTKAIVLLLGIGVLGATAVYTGWHATDQHASKDGAAKNPGMDTVAVETESAATTSGGIRIDGARPERLAVAESVRPNIVTYKQGKPVWELPYDQLHEHVDDLRALADAGWGQAVLPLVRLVSDCLGNRDPRTEQEVRDQARAMRERRLANQSDWPEDEVQRQVAQVDQWLEYHLQYSARRRAACAAVTAVDEDRIMDWLELALEQRHPKFLAGYLRWELLPDRDAWMVRHAERLANFNQRFQAAYLDGVYAGERGMLDLAWKLYATRKILAEPDPFRAFAFNHAADLDARERAGVTRQFMDSFRIEQIGLAPERVDDARDQGEQIYARCCAEARMPR